MLVKVLFSSFLILFSVDFWKYSVVGFFLTLGYFVLLKVITVHRLKILPYGVFHIIYPLIAAVTIIPLIILLTYNSAVVRVIFDKDTEPLAGLLVNAFAFLYLNIIISIGSVLFDKVRIRL